MEKDPAGRLSRPEFPRQRLHGRYPPGRAEALLLPGQLLHVQEDAAAEAQGADEGLGATGEADQGDETVRHQQKGRSRLYIV